MNKGNVIQLCIIVIGLIMGFLSLQYFLSSFATIIYWIGTGMSTGTYMESTLSLTLIVFLQAIACWLLITRSASLATYITDKTNTNFNFRIVTSNHDLLYLMLLIIGLYFAIVNLPSLLSAIFSAFREKISNKIVADVYTQQPKNWFILIMNVILPTILLMYAKPIADYFCKNINNDAIILEQDIDEISTDN